MNEFQESEQKGKILFQSFLNYIKPDQSYPTINEYDPVDYYFIKDGIKVIVEIKVRNQKYENYPTHLIELDKYCNITHQKIEQKCQMALYCNFFGDDKLYVYNLKRINTCNSKITNRLCAKKTVVDKGLENKIFLELNTRLASVFIRQNGIWILDRKAEIN